MSGLFGTLNIAKKSINAHQAAVNTTSHNISNADTEGYSRQRVSLEASKPITMYGISGAMQMGTGVDITSISRVRDEFLDGQIRNEISTSEYYKSRDEFMSEIEAITMEPSYDDGPGLSVLVGKMWDAWQEFSKSPEDSNTRTGVVETTKTVTDTMNNIYTQLNDLNTHSNDLARSKVYEFNSTIAEIEALNKQISGIMISGQEPNDLLDKQDVLIDKLAGMMDIDVHRDIYGKVTIKTGSNITIVGENKQSLSFVEEVASDGTLKYSNNGDLKDVRTAKDKVDTTEFNGVKLVWVSQEGDISKAEIESGSIEGYVSVTKDIENYQNQLNALAKAIAYSVNMLHNDGYKGEDPVPEDYVPVFVAGGVSTDNIIDNENAITAGNITVNTNLKDNLKAYSSSDPTGEEGNGDRALAISMLRDTKLDINQFLPPAKDRTDNSFEYVPNSGSTEPYCSIKDAASGATIEGYYRSFIVEVGTSAGQASSMVDSQDALLSQLQLRRESVSGVSIDEETANLIQYQHSLNAAFRTVSVVDELLSAVINLIK